MSVTMKEVSLSVNTQQVTDGQITDNAMASRALQEFLAEETMVVDNAPKVFVPFHAVDIVAATFTNVSYDTNDCGEIVEGGGGTLFSLPFCDGESLDITSDMISPFCEGGQCGGSIEAETTHSLNCGGTATEYTYSVTYGGQTHTGTATVETNDYGELLRIDYGEGGINIATGDGMLYVNTSDEPTATSEAEVISWYEQYFADLGLTLTIA